MTQLRIGLELKTSSKKPSKKIEIKGVVVRKEKDPDSPGYLIAIFFSDIKPADQKKLDDFLVIHSKT